jgi:hypothetical protein
MPMGLLASVSAHAWPDIDMSEKFRQTCLEGGWVHLDFQHHPHVGHKEVALESQIMFVVGIQILF